MAGRRCGRAAAVLLALALTAGCGSAPAPSSARPAPRMPTAGVGTVGAAATTTPGARLRAGLTYLLVERVHLQGAARAARGGPGEAAVTSALDAAAEELAGELGEAVRTDARLRPAVLAALRREDRALATSDRQGLRAAHGALVTALARAVPRTPTATLSEALLGGAGPLLEGARPGGALDRSAARAAGLLANAVAASAGLGSTETPAAALRAGLTALLTTRTHLHVAAARDPRGPLPAALAGSALALADLLADGERDVTRDLQEALRRTDAALADAAAAAGTADAARGGQARAELEAARARLTARLAQSVPALPAELVGPELTRHEQRLLTAVEQAVAAEPRAVVSLRAVAAGAPVAAALLAGGLADDRRLS